MLVYLPYSNMILYSVCAPWSTEWLTVLCDATGGSDATLLYAAHWSEWTIDPLATWAWMMGSKVVASLLSTISMYLFVLIEIKFIDVKIIFYQGLECATCLPIQIPTLPSLVDDLYDANSNSML